MSVECGAAVGLIVGTVGHYRDVAGQNPTFKKKPRVCSFVLRNATLALPSTAVNLCWKTSPPPISRRSRDHRMTHTNALGLWPAEMQ
jgi:hypothetical protein